MTRKVYMYSASSASGTWAQPSSSSFWPLPVSRCTLVPRVRLRARGGAPQYAGWSLIILIAFAIFWHFTTGEWRHYVPTTDKLREMLLYYVSGIFRNEKRPVSKTEKV